MELWLKRWLFFRSVPTSTRLMKKSPARHHTTYSHSCCEPNEATSETSAAKPIGWMVDAPRSLTEDVAQQVRTHTQAALWAVSHEPKENGNSWFVGTISAELLKRGAVLNSLFTWILSMRCTLQPAIFSVMSAAKKRTTSSTCSTPFNRQIKQPKSCRLVTSGTFCWLLLSWRSVVKTENVSGCY